MPVFLAPHPDDETLFGAFTLLREKPLVIICFDCGEQRIQESHRAMEILGCEMSQWRIDGRATPHAQHDPLSLLREFVGEKIYAPAWESGGHHHHNLISDYARGAFPPEDVTEYLTYTQTGPELKRSTWGQRVEIEDSRWVLKKLQALACYTSQIASPPGYPSFVPFLEPQWEFYV